VEEIMVGRSRFLMKSAAAFAALGMTLGSTANAAATEFRAVDPLVAVSLFGSSQSQSAVCTAGSQAAVAGAAAAAQSGAAPGCVLPVSAEAPPPPVADAVAPEPMVTRGGIGVFPILGGVALIAVLAVVLLSQDDDDGRIDLPISP
jgi:hypothetical protein